MLLTVNIIILQCYTIFKNKLWIKKNQVSKYLTILWANINIIQQNKY